MAAAAAEQRLGRCGLKHGFRGFGFRERPKRNIGCNRKPKVGRWTAKGSWKMRLPHQPFQIAAFQLPGCYHTYMLLRNFKDLRIF